MTYLSRREVLAGYFSTLMTSSAAADQAVAKKKSIFMVLWRGETKVELGFQAYFVESDIPLDITVRSLDRNIGRLPEILKEIDRVEPDLIYTWGTSVTLGIAGRDPTLTTGSEDYPPQIIDRPILFTMVSQPIRSRIIRSFGSTGRNLTGVSHFVPLEIQIQAMQAYMPIDRIAVIYTPSEPNSVLNVEQLIALGHRLNIRVYNFPVPPDVNGSADPETLPDLVAKAAASGAQFLYLGPDSFIGQYAARITDLANAYRLPSFASTERMLASSNALYGLVAPYAQVGRFTAMKAKRILFENELAGEIPVEVLPELSYQIRADVARDLEIFPTLSLLDYAEIIIP